MSKKNLKIEIKRNEIIYFWAWINFSVKLFEIPKLKNKTSTFTMSYITYLMLKTTWVNVEQSKQV